MSELSYEQTLLHDLAEVMDQLTPQERRYVDQLLDMPAEKSPAALKIEKDSVIWRRSVFPTYFSKQDGWFHTKAWDKIWAVEQHVAPRPLLLPWSRDLGKSVVIRTGGISLAARGLRRYILYFSGTQEQSDKHVMTISRMLRSSGIAMYYPDMGTAQLNDVNGAQVSWNRKRIVTASGLVIDSLGLDSASRGINYEELRPDVIIVDDVDKATDSPIEVRKKIELLAGSIFPTGQDNTWIIFAQNVIHDNSVMARTLDDRAEILHDCDIIGPVPALKSYSFSRTMGKGGRPKYTILKGETTWSGFSLMRAEKELNASGYEFFEREYQHNTKLIKPGAIYPGYSALHHIVTWEELAQGFADAGLNIRGKNEDEYVLPYYWNKGLGLDFGTTLEHPSVLRWVTVPGEYDPYNDIWIFYRERCLPKYPHQKGEAVEPVSPIVLSKLIREVERPWREADNMVTRVMSHEQTAAQRTFNEDEALFAKQAYDFGDEKVDYSAFDGMDFRKRKGDARSGIAQMQDRFFLDTTKQHPFRRYPDGYIITHEDGTQEDLSGQQVMGRPYVIFVVDNDQGGLYLDTEGKLNVQAAHDDGGMIRSRSERPHYCNASSQDGRQQNKPVAFFNDGMDCLVAGTLVTTERGDIPIETVTADDMVLTRKGWAATSGAFLVHESHKVVSVQMSNGATLRGTPNHLVWTENRGFVFMSELRYFDDTILSRTVPVHALTGREHESEEPVYDLTVFGTPEYFANGILVHNSERYLAESFAVETAPATRDQRIEKEVEKRNPSLALDKVLQAPSSLNRQTTLSARQRLVDDIDKHLEDSPGMSYGNAMVDRLERMRDA